MHAAACGFESGIVDNIKLKPIAVETRCFASLQGIKKPCRMD